MYPGLTTPIMTVIAAECPKVRPCPVVDDRSGGESDRIPGLIGPSRQCQVFRGFEARLPAPQGGKDISANGETCPRRDRDQVAVLDQLVIARLRVGDGAGPIPSPADGIIESLERQPGPSHVEVIQGIGGRLEPSGSNNIVGVAKDDLFAECGRCACISSK